MFRIWGLYKLDVKDFTFTDVYARMGSLSEVGLGIICANLPAIRPVLFKWFRRDAVYSTGPRPSRYSRMAKSLRRLGYTTNRRRMQEPGLQGSDTEVLTGQRAQDAMSLTPTRGSRTNHRQGGQSFELTDIVVRTDIDVSTDQNEAQGSHDEPNRSIRIEAPGTGTLEIPASRRA